MKKICGIYMICNTVNNHVYIGQSIDVHGRYKSHISRLKANIHSNQHLQYAWNKYGETVFSFQLLKACKPQYLNRFEKLYIKIYNAEGDDGYNMTSGGEGRCNYKMSLESKKKCSEAKIGDKNPMYGKNGKLHHMYGIRGKYHPNYGKHFTQEHKDKISQSLMGHKVLKEVRDKISKTKTGTKLSQEKKDEMACTRNTTGYFRVIKYKDNNYKQGFCWRYVYRDDDGKAYTLQSATLNKLEEKVKANNLIWKKIK